MRTVLCLACLEFVSATRANLLEAARDHVIENLDTHRLRELCVLDLDVTAERLITSALG